MLFRLSQFNRAVSYIRLRSLIDWACFVLLLIASSRSSHPEVFLEKGVLIYAAKLLCNVIEITLWHGCSPVIFLHIFRTPFPACVRCPWEILIRSPLRETSQGPLRNISRDDFFCDVFKTFQKHLKKNVFCVTYLRRLEHISKKMSFQWHLWDVSKTSSVSICSFSKIPHKTAFVWFP